MRRRQDSQVYEELPAEVNMISILQDEPLEEAKTALLHGATQRQLAADLERLSAQMKLAINVHSPPS